MGRENPDSRKTIKAGGARTDTALEVVEGEGREKYKELLETAASIFEDHLAAAKEDIGAVEGAEGWATEAAIRTTEGILFSYAEKIRRNFWGESDGREEVIQLIGKIVDKIRSEKGLSSELKPKEIAPSPGIESGKGMNQGERDFLGNRIRVIEQKFEREFPPAELAALSNLYDNFKSLGLPPELTISKDIEQKMNLATSSKKVSEEVIQYWKKVLESGLAQIDVSILAKEEQLKSGDRIDLSQSVSLFELINHDTAKNEGDRDLVEKLSKLREGLVQMFTEAGFKIADPRPGDSLDLKVHALSGSEYVEGISRGRIARCRRPGILDRKGKLITKAEVIIAN